MPEVTVAQLAKALDVTEKAVRQAEQTGRIARRPSGKFDLEQAIRDFERNRKGPRKPGRAATAGARPPVNRARRKHQDSYERFRAEKMRVIVDTMKGRLVDHDVTVRRVTELIVAERSSWTLAVSEWAKAGSVKFGVDVAELEIWLDEIVRAHLESLTAPRLTRIAGARKAS